MIDVRDIEDLNANTPQNGFSKQFVFALKGD